MLYAGVFSIAMMLSSCSESPEIPLVYQSSPTCIHVSFPKSGRFARITFDSASLKEVTIVDSNLQASNIASSVEYDNRTSIAEYVLNHSDPVSYNHYFNSKGQYHRTDTALPGVKSRHDQPSAKSLNSSIAR